MKTRRCSRCVFDFSFPDLGTQALVEESGSEVIVRATRDTFSEKRKVHFIRELAAEGFISDSYQKFSGFESSPWLSARWLVDSSWLKAKKAPLAPADRFMFRLLIVAPLLWLALMVGAYLR